MDEKKVREAVYCMKADIGETMCEECVNYYKCDHTKVDDMMRTAIEALEKQLPKKVEYEDGFSNNGFARYRMAKCPTCDRWYNSNEGAIYCVNCCQRLDWSE